MREWILAVLLAIAAAAVTKGAFEISTAAGWIGGGLLFGLLVWLVVPE